MVCYATCLIILHIYSYIHVCTMHREFMISFSGQEVTCFSEVNSYSYVRLSLNCEYLPWKSESVYLNGLEHIYKFQLTELQGTWTKPKWKRTNDYFKNIILAGFLEKEKKNSRCSTFSKFFEEISFCFIAKKCNKDKPKTFRN